MILGTLYTQLLYYFYNTANTIYKVSQNKVYIQ